MIRQDPIDLLRHPLVVAAKAGFDVRHGDVELGGCQRAGECRVRVAVDEHDVGPLGFERGFERFEHPAGLRAVTIGPDPEFAIGPLDPQLVEERHPTSGRRECCPV